MFNVLWRQLIFSHAGSADKSSPQGTTIQEMTPLWEDPVSSINCPNHIFIASFSPIMWLQRHDKEKAAGVKNIYFRHLQKASLKKQRKPF